MPANANEITAAVTSLFEAGSYDFRGWFSKQFGVDKYGLKPSQVGKYNKLTEFGLNEVLWHFILDKLMGNGGSALTSANAFCIHNIALEYHPAEVSKAIAEQESRAAKRIEKVNKRILELSEQKKQFLKPKSRPGKK